MEYLSAFLTVSLIHILAVISPGPDFVLITRNSLIYSRKTAIYSALGLALGILVHVTYSLVGIGLLISKSVALFSLIKFMGALYLIYIGYKSITDKSKSHLESQNNKNKDLTQAQAIRMGFLTNVTNPKATLFFLSLFTLVINPNTPVYVKLLMGAEMSIATFAWFAFLGVIFTHQIIKKRISKIQHYAEKFMGAILIALGLKIAFSADK